MKKYLNVFCHLILMLTPLFSISQTIVSTRHNLSVSGPGPVKATSESQICIFCHTPHGSSPVAPLWNRTNSGATYVLYTSSTLNSTSGQPNGSSVLCLACHDGTIALGNVINPSTPITMVTGTMPRGNLTTDLSNDHPVSFIYNGALAAADGQLLTPPLSTVVLDGASRVQCTSCHDPHKNVYTKFLLASNDNSALCLLCHNTNYWSASTHKTSTNTWNGTGSSPWAHIEYPFPTVARNACENCHDPHNAAGSLRTMKKTPEENNCLDCHSGTVAASTKNISTQLAKSYKHNVAGYTGIHDPTEANAVVTQHVECNDCHNPHASNATTASAPAVNGYITKVSGINQSGAAVSLSSNEYEICYKCHAGNSWAPAPATARLIVQNNTRLEFATTNPSFHPVVGPRNNSEITPNLLSPNTATTVIYCSACHASDGSGSPAGPHGSIYPQILKQQYVKTDPNPESAAAYALCYSCHNRNNLINDINTFPEHHLHIVNESAPCNTCHDPHGISSTQGNSTNNSSLINFRTGIVTTSATGQLKFEDTGVRHGRCYLTCHGQDHDPKTY
jgi:predicted CXXCH cytochrome family protein